MGGKMSIKLKTVLVLVVALLVNQKIYAKHEAEINETHINYKAKCGIDISLKDINEIPKTEGDAQKPAQYGVMLLLVPSKDISCTRISINDERYLNVTYPIALFVALQDGANITMYSNDDDSKRPKQISDRVLISNSLKPQN